MFSGTLKTVKSNHVLQKAYGKNGKDQRKDWYWGKCYSLIFSPLKRMNVCNMCMKI